MPKGPDRLGFDDYFAAYGFHHEYYTPHAYYHEDGPQKIFVDEYEPYSQVKLAIRHLRRLRENPDRPFAMFLSLGSPGVPGAGLVCLSVVLSALNVPIEAIGLVIAINPILEMFTTTSNTTGDVAAALIVAKSEKQLDVDKFNSP